ncbi:unnamed protein product [Fraxinus pennsylvanica]|uniref:Ternary complex factor MIP1 leucine-zipper domain-containing protein n=1 Tax=Fraxinus pennsylvanica TaxID=56036 RepID=A0AAD2EAL8_9LAMI|nr:unnamed protein product [Fraxinus pennsylvanica]
MSRRVRKKNVPIVEEDKERANGNSLASTHGYAPHRRSKSASERNLNLTRVGDSHCTQDFNQSHGLAAPTNNARASPLQEKSFTIKTDYISNHRASLEKDIEQLQGQLQQEKSMRMLLEKAMGRASSTLSPGHRHFAAQTKELIAEIELLEEEVANREQHVLSLYRSIFENCVSRTTSEHSSVVTSPAHVKNESRKHPSIITSAFCSTIKFPLQTFHSLATISNSGKKSSLQSKTRHASLLNGLLRPDHLPGPAAQPPTGDSPATAPDRAYRSSPSSRRLRVSRISSPFFGFASGPASFSRSARV